MAYGEGKERGEKKRGRTGQGVGEEWRGGGGGGGRVGEGEAAP